MSAHDNPTGQIKLGGATTYGGSFRRLFAMLLGLCLAGQPACPVLATSPAVSSTIKSTNGEYARTGKAVPGMEGFEQGFTALLQQWAIPGATVAIAKNGRLVYARGFGWCDLENKEPMAPTTLFRIASVSKAITAVAVLKLVEEGKISLDQKAFDILSDLKPCDAGPEGVDPRLFTITVRHLLQMTAGWNRTHTGDPMFAPLVHYASFHCSPTLRADSVAIIRHWMSKQLDFDPGTSYAYSNLCYAVLEQIIKKVSGQRYSEYVKKNVLAPCGIIDMKLGHTRELAANETIYYTFPGQEEANSYFPNVKGVVPLPYGGDFALEALSGPAGWIGSSIDLVRFITTVSGDRSVKSPISQNTFKTMLACPDITYWHHRSEYFGMGWEVLPVEDSHGTGYIYSRVGSFPGSMAFVVHSDDGTAWSFAVNSRPLSQIEFLTQAKMMIKAGVDQQKTWPDWDLFKEYK